MTRKIDNPVEYFLTHIEVQPNGCWLWTGNIAVTGYGRLKVNGKYELAHRFSFKHFNGGIPEGLHLDHLCRNRACVNPSPDHLEPVTLVENIKRGYISRLSGRTHCNKGHLLPPPPRKNEQCHECKIEHSRAKTAEKTKQNALKYAAIGPVCPDCKGSKKKPTGHASGHTISKDQLKDKNGHRKTCHNCGGLFPCYPSESRKYCSLKCAWASKDRVANNPQNNPGWKGILKAKKSDPNWSVKEGEAA